MDITAWLRDLHLEQYDKAFRDNEIDLRSLPHLTAGDLKDLGVAAIGHRRLLLQAIASLKLAATAKVHPISDAMVSDEDVSPKTTSTPEAERRQLTVMFVDLVGSTALSRSLDPEDMRDVIRAYQDAVAVEIARFEGHVAKYSGDGVLAYFGWPTAHEDDAERAIRAGLALTQTITKIVAPTGDALATRIGIATGRVVVGDLIGEGASQEEAVVGDTPNLAARLQALAEPDAVVIAPNTCRLVGGLFEFKDLETHSLKGFQEPIHAWQVVGERSAESRFEARQLAVVAPIVGREHEIALLHDRWARAVEGEGQIVLLAGEAGIGKSRIVRSLTSALADESLTRLRYQCSPYHGSSAFYPIVERLERAAEFGSDDPSEVKLDKLAALLAPSTESMAETTSLLAALLSIPGGERHRLLDLNPQQQKQRTLEVLVEQVETLSNHQPVLIICEDAHWIDPSTQEFFTLLAERIGSVAVMMLVTYRPDFSPPWARHAHTTQLSLSRLTRRQGSEIIEQLADGKTVPAELTEQILRRAEGVPLFIEELTKTLFDSDLLVETGLGYELSSPLPLLAIPATIQDSLMARLDRLASVKEVAQVAAVVGREFSLDVLVAAAARPEEEVEEALDKLAASELVFRRGTAHGATYIFKHALVQETAYRSLLRSTRQTLHGRIARFLEAQSPRIVELQPELLAHHLEEGGLATPAAEFWLKAGKRAKERYANTEAKVHLQRCLSVAGSIQDDRAALASIEIEALLLLGDLAGLAEELDKANECYEQALASAADDTARVFIQNKLHRPSFAVRDGNRIAFYEHGSGEHTLLFVGPAAYGLAVFQPILEQLCQDFRIITVDSRGTGASDPLTRPFPVSEHAEDVATVIETSGCSPVIGVGISRGSNLLIKLAAARPEMIDKLVMVGCPLAPPKSGDLQTFDTEFLRQREIAYKKRDTESLVRLQCDFIFSEPGTDELKRSTIEHRLKLPLDTILNFFDPDPEANVTSLLRRITFPTLVTHGTDDHLISFATAEYLAREIPGAQLHAFEGKGHLPIFTATAQFCDVLRRFVLQETGPAGPD